MHTESVSCELGLGRGVVWPCFPPTPNFCHHFLLQNAPLHAHSYRLYRSCFVHAQVYIGSTVQELISILLDRVEKYHGQVLVAQALAFITAAKSGIRSVLDKDSVSC